MSKSKVSMWDELDGGAVDQFPMSPDVTVMYPKGLDLFIKRMHGVKFGERHPITNRKWTVRMAEMFFARYESVMVANRLQMFSSKEFGLVEAANQFVRELGRFQNEIGPGIEEESVSEEGPQRQTYREAMSHGMTTRSRGTREDEDSSKESEGSGDPEETTETSSTDAGADVGNVRVRHQNIKQALVTNAFEISEDGSENELTREEKMMLGQLRKNVQMACLHYMQYVIAPEMKARVIQMYARKPEVTYLKVKESLIARCQTVGTLALLEQALTIVRQEEDVTMWIRRVGTLKNRLVNIIKGKGGDRTSLPGIEQMCVEVAVRQVTRVERLQISMPPTEAGIRQMTYRQLESLTLKIDVDGIALYRPSQHWKRIKQVVLHRDKADVVESKSSTGSTSRNKKKTNDSRKESKRQSGKNAETYCKTCQEKHPWGEHTRTRKTRVEVSERIKNAARVVLSHMRAGACNRCGKKGHYKKDCTQDKAEDEKEVLREARKMYKSDATAVLQVIEDGRQSGGTLPSAMVRIKTGETEKMVVVALDSGATLTLSATELLEEPTEEEVSQYGLVETKVIVGISGARVTTSKSGMLSIWTNGCWKKVPAYGYATQNLPMGVRVLFGMNAIKMLDVDVVPHIGKMPGKLQIRGRRMENREKGTKRKQLLEIFSGKEARLTKATAEIVGKSNVMKPVDVIHGQDVLDKKTADEIVEKVREERPTVVFLAPPCTTYSRAAFAYGNIPNRKKVAKAKAMVRFAGRVIAEVIAYGGHVMVENPEGSKLWTSKEFGELRDIVTAFGRRTRMVTHHRCMYTDEGTTCYKKATSIWTTLSEELMKALGYKCDGSHKHELLRGRHPDGVARTARAAQYTWKQVDAMAGAIARVEHGDVQGKGIVKQIEQRAEPSLVDEHVYLADRLLRRYLSFPKEAKRDLTHADVKYADAESKLDQEWIGKFKKLNETYATVFHVRADGFIEPANWPELEFEFKEGSKPYREREPRYTPAQREIINEWATERIENGMYEVAHQSEWSGRLHIAYKAVAGQPKDPMRGRFAVRICHDERGKNERIRKVVSSYPNATDAVEEAVGWQRYITSDIVSMFPAFRVKKGKSRDALSIWTGKYGLIRPKRLVFGSINASSYCQAAVRDMEGRHLSDDARRHKVGYQDDSLIFAGRPGDPEERTWQQLYKRWEEYLKLCKEANLTIKPTKTSIGFRKATFYGHEVSARGHVQIDRNIDPIRKAQPPKYVKEVRSILGMMVQAQRRVKDYAVLAKPLTKLTKTNEPFIWGDEQQKAFETLKERIAEQPVLHVHDSKKQLYLYTDASDQGWGAALCHEEKPTTGTSLELQEDTRKVIAWFSKGWTNSMRRKPVYYREAAAMFMGLYKAKRYAESNEHPIIVRVDQRSLKWVKHSEKGLVNSWRAHFAADLDYKVEYIAGETNDLADALSRPPMLGPGVPTIAGLRQYMATLLQELECTKDQINKVRVIAGDETVRVAEMVRNQWPSAKVLTTTATRGSKPAALTVVIPKVGISPGVARQYMDGDGRVAILMPSDLVSEIADQEVSKHQEVQVTPKIAFLGTTMCWLLINMKGPSRVCAALSTAAVEDTKDSWTSEGFNLDEETRDFCWYEQKLLYIREDGSMRVYVPKGSDNGKSYRHTVIMEAHITLGHASPAHVTREVARYYFWPGMRDDVKQKINNCTECSRDTKRNIAHGQYRAKVQEDVATRWSVDFTSHFNGPIMVMYDIDGCNPEMVYVKDRKGTTVVECLKQRIIYRHGVPRLITSDNAKEFESREVKQFCKQFGIAWNYSGGYHPRGNARVERFMGYLNRCLRKVSNNEYKESEIQTTLDRISFGYRNTMRKGIGMSPHELRYGTKLRTSTEPREEPATNTPPLNKPEAEKRRVAMDHRRKVMEKSAQKNRAVQQAASVKMLNRGRKSTEYEVGDLVVVYKPPSQSEVKNRQRRAKHLHQFTACCRVRERNKTMYVVEELGTGRVYRRHVVNLQPHNGVPGIPEATFHVGGHVAVRETAGAAEYRIALVTALEENKNFVHLCATTGKKLHRAKFRRAYVDADDRLSFRRARGEEPFTMVIPRELEQPLVLMRVVLEKDSLTSSSVTRLQEEYPGLQHRVEGTA